jgi:hypothetical protein
MSDGTFPHRIERIGKDDLLPTTRRSKEQIRAIALP